MDDELEQLKQAVDVAEYKEARALKYAEGLKAENERLKAWVDDLHSGMYVNCVYCGHRYGPGETTPVSMGDALKAHIEQCPEHPMSKLKADIIRVQSRLSEQTQQASDLEEEINLIREFAEPLRYAIRESMPDDTSHSAFVKVELSWDGKSEMLDASPAEPLQVGDLMRLLYRIYNDFPKVELPKYDA